jgi:hypothetical protein
VLLAADVPSSAGYGDSHVLQIANVNINQAAIDATADHAIHVVAFFGDVTGNQSYSGLDAQRAARVAVGLDNGFEAFPTIHPVVVADITGDGAISGLDAQRIAQMSVGLDVSEIPPIPQQPLRLAAPGSQSRETSEILDLPGDLLGMTSGQKIQIDIKAAGYGWFVYPTPWDDVELTPSPVTNDLTALPGTSAAERADLLTTVLHELGHVLGFEHEDHGVMDETLPLGTRRFASDKLPLSRNLADGYQPLAESQLGEEAVDEYFAMLP